MAATKSYTSPSTLGLNAQTTGATSSAVNLSTAYGCSVNVSLTNSSTAPTGAATVQVQVSNNWNSGSPTNWTNYGGVLTAGLTGSGVYQFTVELGNLDWQAVQLVYTEATGSGASSTCTADMSVTTGI